MANFTFIFLPFFTLLCVCRSQQGFLSGQTRPGSIAYRAGFFICNFQTFI